MDLIGNGYSGTVYASAVYANQKGYNSGTAFIMKNVKINYSCCVDFMLFSWDYYGATSIFKCGFVYKLDDRVALQTALGLSDSQLELFEALDSSTWSSVLSNQNSVNYLLNNVSGDIMFSAVSDSTVRGLITSSTYASNFTNHEHWGKILTLCQNNPPTVVSKQ